MAAGDKGEVVVRLHTALFPGQLGLQPLLCAPSSPRDPQHKPPVSFKCSGEWVKHLLPPPHWSTPKLKTSKGVERPPPNLLEAPQAVCRHLPFLMPEPSGAWFGVWVVMVMWPYSSMSVSSSVSSKPSPSSALRGMLLQTQDWE